MLLTKIEIKNFRSIKDITIDIKSNCMIFVGKNEAGKSNLLKAIAGGLDSDVYEITAKDKRKKSPNEIIKKNDYSITYFFNLSKEELETILNEYFNDEIYNNLFKQSEKIFSTTEFLESFFSKGTYYYDISDLDGYGQYYALPVESLTMTKKLAQIIQNCTDNNDNTYQENDLIDIDKVSIDSSCYRECSIHKIIEIFAHRLTSYIADNLPETIFWEYDDEYLIPTTTNLNDFISNPHNYPSLNNIFILAGYTDIKNAFSEAFAEDGDYINLLESVSKVATEEFVKKWPDLKTIQISITKDGDNIIAKVKEKVSFNFEDRSDGFKKFISILLMLSTRVETGIINNAIILIDEPDRSLYPTGSKYLRDELIKIAEKNIVCYSTHSPFMIDKKTLGRHLIVTKDNENITTLNEVNNSNFSEDEVLLNAIGISNFEFIQTNNILFEGWGDNRLFKTALKSTKRTHQKLINFFKPFGSTYANGAKDIKSITPLLQLASKNVFIFTDSDSAATEAKNSYKDKHGYMSDNWFTFEDLGGNKDETLEDYIDKALLEEAIEATKIKIDLNKNIYNKPIMQYLSNISKNDKDTFKNYITNNMKPKNIKDTYFERLFNLKAKIENFQAQIEQD